MVSLGSKGEKGTELQMNIGEHRFFKAKYVVTKFNVRETKVK